MESLGTLLSRLASDVGLQDEFAGSLSCEELEATFCENYLQWTRGLPAKLPEKFLGEAKEKIHDELWAKALQLLVTGERGLVGMDGRKLDRIVAGLLWQAILVNEYSLRIRRVGREVGAERPRQIS